MTARTESVNPIQKLQAFWDAMEAGMRRLMVIIMVETLAVGLFVSLLAPWYKTLGYESITQGWLNLVLQLTSAVVATAGGVLADNLGRKNMYTAGQLLRCAVIVLLLSTRSFIGLVMVSLVRGLSIVQSPARTAFIAAYTVKESRATTLGVYQTMSVIASVVSPLAAGFLADQYGVRPPLLLALVLAVLAIFLAVPLKEPVNGFDNTPSASREGSETVPSSHQQHTRGYSIKCLAEAGRQMFQHSDSRRLVFLLVAFLANGLANGATNILLPFTVMDKFSSAYQAVAGLSVISSLGTALVMLIGGRIADVKGRRGIILSTGTIFPMLMMLILWANTLWQVYTLLMLISMIGNISSPAVMAINMEAVDEEYRATWDGFGTGATSAGMAVGGVIGGVMYKMSSTWAWITVITLFALQVICYYLVLERDGKPETPGRF
ncbi:MAG TPA: MFS transporter [Firmicutes bacterium]|nr:MFS transporter [Candidatus Fermentithermobacillaceae bacterium]